MTEEISPWFTEYCKGIFPLHLKIFSEIQSNKPEISSANDLIAWHKEAYGLLDEAHISNNIELPLEGFKDSYLDWAFHREGEMILFHKRKDK